MYNENLIKKLCNVCGKEYEDDKDSVEVMCRDCKFKYLDKLDKNYFKHCVVNSILYYNVDDCGKEESIKGLIDLRSHVCCLRNTFYLFAGDGIKELIKLVDDAIAKVNGLEDDYID